MTKKDQLLKSASGIHHTSTRRDNNESYHNIDKNQSVLIRKERVRSVFYNFDGLDLTRNYAMR